MGVIVTVGFWCCVSGLANKVFFSLSLSKARAMDARSSRDFW